MPGIDGMSLARKLRASYPRLGIILVSGQLNDESRWIVSEDGFQFLPKPFNLTHLRDAVVSVLGEPQPPVKS
jgi:DNA-binding response OmpR family regulator